MASAQFGIGASDLDINNVRARFNANGSLFWDLHSVARYEVPKVYGSNSFRRSPIFMSTLWFHAIDTLGDTLISVQLYGQNGTDFTPGVLPKGAQIGFSPILANNIVKLDYYDVEAARRDSNRLTSSIRNWPTSYQYNGNTFPLARFVDVNNDGNYNPELGDYPVMRGDQSLTFYYHDMVEHTLSKSKPIGLQIETTGFSWSASNYLNDFTFIRYRIISQNQNLQQFRVGVLADFDLGNYADDIVGTDTSRNMIYVMNGDDFDEGVIGYGLNPPAFGVVFLNQPLCASCINENTNTGPFRNPQTMAEFRNMLYGLNIDGDSMIVNTPNVPPNTYSTFHMAGDPTVANSWTMLTDNRFKPADYRMLGITGRDSLLQGDTFDLLLCYAFAMPSQSSGSLTNSLVQLRSSVDHLLNNLKILVLERPRREGNCFTGKKKPTGPGVGLNDQAHIKKSLVSIYPNPATNKIQVIKQEDNQPLSFQLFDNSGKVLISQILTEPLTSLNLNSMAPGIYFISVQSESFQQQFEKIVIHHSF